MTAKKEKCSTRVAETVNIISPRMETKIIQREQKKRFGNIKTTQSILGKAPQRQSQESRFFLHQQNALKKSLSRREMQPPKASHVMEGTEPRNIPGELLGQEGGEKIPKALWGDGDEPAWAG